MIINDSKQANAYCGLNCSLSLTLLREEFSKSPRKSKKKKKLKKRTKLRTDFEPIDLLITTIRTCNCHSAPKKINPQFSIPASSPRKSPRRFYPCFTKKTFENRILICYKSFSQTSADF